MYTIKKRKENHYIVENDGIELRRRVMPCELLRVPPAPTVVREGDIDEDIINRERRRQRLHNRAGVEMNENPIPRARGVSDALAEG